MATARAGGRQTDGHSMLVFALGRMIGSSVMVQATDGRVFYGILHGADLAGHESVGVSLSMAYECHPKSGEKPFDVPVPTPDKTKVIPQLIIKGHDVAQIKAVGVDVGEEAAPPQTGHAGERDRFTDYGISGANGSGASPERELTPWASDGPVLELDLDKEAQSMGRWDAAAMFKHNEAVHGIKDTFDENIYTTKLNYDPKDAKSRERMAKAKRLEQEILGSAGGSSHVREERGHVTDQSEEDKFSAVIRTEGGTGGGGSAYVAPHRRKKTSPEPPEDHKEQMEKLRQFKDTFQLGESKTPESAKQNGVKNDTDVADAKTSAAPPEAVGSSSGSTSGSTAEAANKPEAPAPAKPEKKLNPTAASFSFNPMAGEFSPSARAVPQPVATAAPQVHPSFQQQQLQQQLQQQQQLHQQQQHQQPMPMGPTGFPSPHMAGYPPNMPHGMPQRPPFLPQGGFPPSPQQHGVHPMHPMHIQQQPVRPMSPQQIQLQMIQQQQVQYHMMQQQQQHLQHLQHPPRQ
eukprot:m.479419 g.479419  ORF g.479419 m.479419 type:complete len:517 (-) comp21440_c0_seq1:222-1772(-)